MRDTSQRNMRTNKSNATKLNRLRSRRARQMRFGGGVAFLLMVVAATWYSGNVSPSRAYNGSVSRQVVINQVYAGGGVSASSTYANDFVELLNTSTVSVDISGWSLQERSSNGSSSIWTIINLCASTTPGTCVIPSGRYYLVSGFSNGAGGAALPAPNIADVNMTLNLGSGEVALVNSRTGVTTGNPVPCSSIGTLGAPAAIDFIGWGVSGGTCSETAVAASTGAHNISYRRSDVSIPRDTDNNLVDFPNGVPLPRNSSSAPNAPSAADGVVNGVITDSNGEPLAGMVVNLSGAQNRKTITNAEGVYQFDSVETSGFYTVRPASENYSFSPAEKSFSQLGNSTEASFTGTRASGANAIDTPEYFVRQQYLDFLGREPDEAGFNFWSDQILECGSDAGCLERKAINVSAAYFLSIEFQATGGLVDGLYRASYGRAPRYDEFMPDARTIATDVVVGQPDWEKTMAANKAEFLAGWVERADFRTAYDGLTNQGYVDALISHTGISFDPSERSALVSGLDSGASTRAAVLGQIAGNDRFVNAKRNETFVMMEYFGYLRRDPDASGYQYWLNKLNQFNGDFEQAEMVKAFISSGEYRQRFGQ